MGNAHLIPWNYIGSYNALPLMNEKFLIAPGIYNFYVQIFPTGCVSDVLFYFSRFYPLVSWLSEEIIFYEDKNLCFE